jgi:hypothetical protein
VFLIWIRRFRIAEKSHEIANCAQLCDGGCDRYRSVAHKAATTTAATVLIEFNDHWHNSGFGMRRGAREL